MDDDAKQRIAKLSSEGLTHAAAGDFERALTAFRASIELAPTMCDHYNAGNMLLALNRPAEACDAFDHALACDDSYAEAWCNRGIALFRLEKGDLAIASFERALALAPTLDNARHCRATALVEGAAARKKARGEQDRYVDAAPGGFEDQMLEPLERALELGLASSNLARWAWAERLIRLERVAHTSGRTLARYLAAAEEAARKYADDPWFREKAEDARELASPEPAVLRKP
jgi:tetratricopeptide (TPR) repeat protein